MSVLETFYNFKFNVLRKTTASDTSLDTYSTHLSNQEGVFRPVTDVNQLYKAGNQGLEFKLFCKVIDIRPNDIIQNSNNTSEKYGVIGVQTYEDLEGDTETHLEVRIAKK